jgi:hypothetical protein
MTMRTIFCSAVMTTSIVAFAGTASADDWAYHKYDSGGALFSLGAAFRYGIWTGSDQFKNIDGGVNPFGPDIGIFAGVSFKKGLYLGADFNYFWGGSRSVATPNAGAGASVNVYDVLGVVGYDLWVHHAGVLRPKIGLGIGVARGTFCLGGTFSTACGTDSKSGFTIAPGLEYLHFFGPGFFSLEARWEDVMLDGPDASAVVLGIGLGAAL